MFLIELNKWVKQSKPPEKSSISASCEHRPCWLVAERGHGTGPCMRCARGAGVPRLCAGSRTLVCCGPERVWGTTAACLWEVLRQTLGGAHRGLSLAGVGCPVKILTGRETEFFVMKVILTFRQLGLKITFSPIRKKAVTVTDQFTGC